MSDSDRFDPRATALLLAGGMCLIPFVQPRHMPPIGAFYDEWLAFAFGVAAIGLAAACKSAPMRLPAAAIFLARFCHAVLVRANGGHTG